MSEPHTVGFSKFWLCPSEKFPRHQNTTTNAQYKRLERCSWRNSICSLTQSFVLMSKFHLSCTRVCPRYATVCAQSPIRYLSELNASAKHGKVRTRVAHKRTALQKTIMSFFITRIDSQTPCHHSCTDDPCGKVASFGKQRSTLYRQSFGIY